MFNLLLQDGDALLLQDDDNLLLQDTGNGISDGYYVAPHRRTIAQIDRNKRFVRPVRGSLRGKL